MTTSAEVRTAWEENIWQNSAVLALTSKCYTRDVLADSQFAVSQLYHDPQDGTLPQLNFFICLVRRQQTFSEMGRKDQTFEVRVTYYLQQTDFTSDSYNAVGDRLETIDDLVLSSLTRSWDSTVDYYTGGTPDRIDVTTVDSRQCWRGSITYLGYKATTI